MPVLDYGYWWIEVSFPYNTIRDHDLDVRDRLLESLLGVFDFLKNSGHYPEAATWGLTWLGQVPCKRQGRRFRGMHVTTQNEIMADPAASPPQHPELFVDRVAYAGWPFDLHNPKGIYDLAHPAYSSYRTPYMFSIPLRSLISKDVGNLMFAGRLASFSYVVFGSARVMKTGSSMGQAAGTAAAYAVLRNMRPQDLPASNASLFAVQQQLIRDDAFVIGIVNQDPRDYARRASVSASSQTAGSPPANVLTGQTRNVVTPLNRSTDIGGVPEGQGVPGSNRWISAGLPASITLAWPSSVPVAQAELVFDTGLHRKLTFSVRGGGVGDPWGPQRETVRDYQIYGQLAGGDWVLLCNVTGNYQRRRVHRLPCTPIHPPQAWPPINSGGGSGPPAPPAGGPPGSVQVQVCNPDRTGQRWLPDPTSGLIRLWQSSARASTGDGGVCLGVNTTASAAGGHGNAVVAAPCTGRLQTGGLQMQWVYERNQTNTTLRLASPVACSNWSGECGCAKPVVPSGVAVPGEAVEVWPCTDAAENHRFTFLALGDGHEDGVLLATNGLCVESDAGALDGEAPPPVRESPLTALRVNVTATNGDPDARIAEIRVYGADGLAPFPESLAK